MKVIGAWFGGLLQMKELDFFRRYQGCVLKICSILLLGAVLLSGGLVSAAAGEGPVVVVTIRGEIDGGQAALVQKALTAAKDNGATAVLVEIDTFGGMVDAAVKIRDMISETTVPTICYIKNRAWSAGALIALAHKHIVIAPGGSIGAAEPIPTTEKTVAALRAEFAATANKTGRDPKVAEAMVDKSLGYPGFAEPGQILALADYQAVKVGYAEIVATDRAAVMARYGLSEKPVLEYSQGWPEKLAGWLSDPAVKSILISIIVLAVLTEIKTAGMGIAAVFGIVAAVLFFGGQWMSGLAGWTELLLFIGGVVLVIVELTVPGFGFFGLAGIACILFSFFLALGADLTAVNLLAASLAGAIVIFLIIVRRLPSSRLWRHIVLHDAETTQSGYTSGLDYEAYLGREGLTRSPLRPAGIMVLDEQQLDVVSEGQFIPPQTRVTVVNVSSNRIVVRPVKEE
ncbi:MAG TPA: NfeD family protein [Patescibacteria group bacterium]|nr:NfeD family protein [Patescibacteria group bacterium]